MPRRLAVNLASSPAVAPSLLETFGGVKVGVFGVADPALGARLGVAAQDPVAAARREVERLRAAGADLVVALAPVDKPMARRVAREAAPDLVVQGRQVLHGQPRAERVGNAFIVTPADELQRVGRIDVVWRGRGTLVDAGGPEATALRRVEIDKAIGRLDEQLAEWAKTGGDAAFIAAKRAEREALLTERKGLDAPWAPPATGSYFQNRLIPLRRSLQRDQGIASAMRKLDAEVAAVNLRGGGAAGAEGARPTVLRRRRQVRELPQVGAGVLEEDRARGGLAHAGRRRQAARLQVRRLPRHGVRRGRRHQPGAHRRACATCSARSATARVRNTWRRRGWKIRWPCTGRRR